MRVTGCHVPDVRTAIIWREAAAYVSPPHYIDVIMTTMASQITSRTVVYSTVFSDADQRKHQSSASVAFVWGIHRDRWIPRTKGQLRGKCFHSMTSSWPDTQNPRVHVDNHVEILWLSAHVDGSVQDCSNSSALAMELLQSCTKPSNFVMSLASPNICHFQYGILTSHWNHQFTSLTWKLFSH